MPYPLSPQMQQIRVRLQAGERLTAKAAWHSTDGLCRGTAQATFARWHAKGMLHIAGWHSYGHSLPAPIFAWGPGRDAVRPRTLGHYERTARWRLANPDKLIAQFNRAKARRLAAHPPKFDAVTAALMGSAR